MEIFLISLIRNKNLYYNNEIKICNTNFLFRYFEINICNTILFRYNEIIKKILHVPFQPPYFYVVQLQRYEYVRNPL